MAVSSIYKAQKEKQINDLRNNRPTTDFFIERIDTRKLSCEIDIQYFPNICDVFRDLCIKNFEEKQIINCV